MSSSQVQSTEVFGQFSPFDLIAHEYLEKLIAKAMIVEYPKKHKICTSGERSWEQFYLLEGEVSLVNDSYALKRIKHTDPEARYTLDDHQPHRFNVISRTPVKLLVVNRDYLDLVLSWSQSGEYNVVQINHEEEAVEETDWLSVFLQSPMVNQLPPSYIQKIIGAMEDIEVVAGEKIIQENQAGDYFYIIKEGAAEVFTVANKNNTDSAIQLKAGQYFGEDALVGETVRNATIVMMSDGIVSRLNKETFDELLKDPLIQRADNETLDKLQNDTARTCEFIDVRLGVEYKHEHVKGSKNIPLSFLRNKVLGLNRDAVYVVTPEGGRRSELAAHMLRQAGLQAYLMEDEALAS